MSLTDMMKKREYHGKNPPTDEQWLLIDETVKLERDTMGIAVPGSGKTSTAKEILWHPKINNSRIVACYFVFSKEMQKEIEPQVPANTVTKTKHAIGYGILAKKFGKLYIPGNKRGERPLTQQILAKFKGYDLDMADGEHYADTKDRIDAAVKLVDMIRANLVDWTDEQAMDDLCAYYGIALDDRDAVYEMMPKVFDDIMLSAGKGIIDFTSMYWLPVHMELEFPKFDLIVGDECQDFNKCDIMFIERLRGNGRLMLIGDPFQSIFGFAGAMPESVEFLKDHFKPAEFPITYCFRCGKNIIDTVTYINPAIRPWKNAKDGEVIKGQYEEFQWGTVPDGALALSRVNSNLVGPAFKLIKEGRKANIKGRDLKAGIISTIRKVKKKANSDSLPILVGTSQDMEVAEEEAMSNRKYVSKNQIETMKDRYRVFRIICDQVSDSSDIEPAVKKLFSEDTKGVVFSSFHRSKGLEAEEVVIIGSEMMRINHPEMQDWEHKQEANAELVAKTRAKNKMTLLEKKSNKQ